ncbi:hypothetical protein N4308_14975, partial [Staphylococcus aureus]|nr:hypothetical protein [Staphylococcus aureus]
MAPGHGTTELVPTVDLWHMDESNNNGIMVSAPTKEGESPSTMHAFGISHEQGHLHSTVDTSPSSYA